MQLRVTDDIFAMFPGVMIGVVVARGVDNAREAPEVVHNLRQAEAAVRALFDGATLPEHPRIAPWRDAYRRFGAKPKDYPSSIENLVRRVAKGHSLPEINLLVDLYNAVSLRHLLPVGGEDLDAIQGDVLLTTASNGEAAVRLLGEQEERAPRPGEVIYKDDLGAICRRWNWKEADRTKLTSATGNALLVVEGLPPVERSVVDDAVDELARLVERHCGGTVRTALVDQHRRSLDLA